MTADHPLLLDAKKEYVIQLALVMAPFVFTTLNGFVRDQLRTIPEWNSTTVNTKAIEIEGKHPYLGDLITACFVSWTKVMSSIRSSGQPPAIKLALPQTSAFVHAVYINTAKTLYAEGWPKKMVRSQKLDVIVDAIDASIRSLLPIKDILRAYVAESMDEYDHAINTDKVAELPDHGGHVDYMHQNNEMMMDPQIIQQHDMENNGMIQQLQQPMMVMPQPPQQMVMQQPAPQMIQQPMVVMPQPPQQMVMQQPAPQMIQQQPQMQQPPPPVVLSANNPLEYIADPVGIAEQHQPETKVVGINHPIHNQQLFHDDGDLADGLGF